MAEPEWTVLAGAGRVRLLEFSSTAGDPEGMPRPGEPSDEPMRRFARAVVDVLEQAYALARFEFLRIAVEPRFEAPLRAEIDRRLDLPRAVLEWRALELIPPETDAAPQAGADSEQVPQASGTPPSRESPP